MEVIGNIKNNQSKYVNYLILLQNGETIKITAETFEGMTDDDSNLFCYRFYSDRKIILEIDAAKIDVILSENHVDPLAVIAAIKKPKRRAKKKTRVKEQV